MGSFGIFPFIAILGIFALNYLLFKHQINKSINTIIKPRLESKGLTYVKYKWCGLLSNGDFDDGSIWSFVAIKGDPRTYIYIDIYYLDSNFEKKITARIYTLFGFIRKVTFSNSNFN